MAANRGRVASASASVISTARSDARLEEDGGGGGDSERGECRSGEEEGDKRETEKR